jgi:hypothetical protein
MNLLKKEILNQKTLLLKYKSVIPKPQLVKFENDIKSIFDKFEQIEDETMLNGINKLAKAKYKAIVKIYGEIKNDDGLFDKVFDNLEALTSEQKKIVEDFSIKLQEEQVADPEDEKIGNLPGFNPTFVKQFREEYNQTSREINRELVKRYEDYINKLVEDRKKGVESQPEVNTDSKDKGLKIKPEDIQEFLKNNKDMTEQEAYERLSQVEGFSDYMLEKEKVNMKSYFDDVTERNKLKEEQNPLSDDKAATDLVRGVHRLAQRRNDKFIMREEQFEAMEKQTQVGGI